MDQQLFQIINKELLGTKKDLLVLFHFAGVGVIQRRGKAVSCLGYDLSKEGTLCVRKLQDFVFKKFHAGGIAGKGYHNDIGGIFAGGA